MSRENERMKEDEELFAASDVPTVIAFLEKLIDGLKEQEAAEPPSQKPEGRRIQAEVMEPTTHDYFKHRGFGHDYTFDPIDDGQKGRMMGWGRGIKAGDYLLLDNGEHGSTRYQVETIKYFADPGDMWSARVKFAPRPNPARESNPVHSLAQPS